MSTQQSDGRDREQRITNTVLDLISDPDGSTTTDSSTGRCASCNDVDTIQWLRLTVDWEDYLISSNDMERPTDVCQVPLCTRCRAWAEMIEIAEMSMECQSEANRRRIRRERNRLLDSLSIELVEGLRLSEDLTAYATR